MLIEMISTGDEVMTGFITDTNATFLAQELLQCGLKMTRRSTVCDNLTDLVHIFQERGQVADVVIVNGGMGPTSDDYSSEAASIACGQPLALNTEWQQRLVSWYQQRQKVMPPVNIKQAMLPKGSVMIDNSVGTACGFRVIIGKAMFIFTPGVPKEFKTMVREQIIPYLQQRPDFPQLPANKVELYYTFGIGESSIAELLSKQSFPKNIILGYRVATPCIELKLISEDAAHTDFATARTLLQQTAGQYLIASGKFDFYEQISTHLQQRSLAIYDVSGYHFAFNTLLSKLPACQLYSLDATCNFTTLPTADLMLTITKDSVDNKLFLTLQDNSNSYRLTRHVEILSPNCFQNGYVAFMLLDMLRRYLCGQDPIVQYDFICDC